MQAAQIVLEILKSRNSDRLNSILTEECSFEYHEKKGRKKEVKIVSKSQIR